MVVSDHGFLPVSREIRPNVRLRRRGLLRLDAAGGVAAAEARFVMNHGAGWVYTAGDGDRARLARDLRTELAGLEGVSAVWTPDEYAGLGLPTPEENPRVGDLLLEAAPGYFMVDQATGEDEHGPPRYRGTHGQRPHHADNHAMFVAAGRGDPPGRHARADHQPRRRPYPVDAPRPAPGAGRGPCADRDLGLALVRRG